MEEYLRERMELSEIRELHDQVNEREFVEEICLFILLLPLF